MLVFALVVVPALIGSLALMVLSTLAVSFCAVGFRRQEARHKAALMSLVFWSFTFLALTLALMIMLNVNPFLWPSVACGSVC